MTSLEDSIKAIIPLLTRARSAVLTTHVNPDGDGIGSELALADWLAGYGCRAEIVNHSPTPDVYRFLDPDARIRVYRPERDAALIAGTDVLVVLDTNQPARLRSMEVAVLASPAAKLCIDHHLEPHSFATHRLIDPEATSTGEILYRMMVEASGRHMLPSIATALYCAIMTDTGSFRYPRVDPDIHRIVACLIEAGADPVQIYASVYEQWSNGRIHLLGRMLAGMGVRGAGRLAYVTVTQEMLRATGTQEEDTDNFTTYPMSVAGVVVGILFLELKDGVKISVRSKGEIPINELAKQFGGNGHKNAAGARLFAVSLAEVQERVLAAADGYLQEGFMIVPRLVTAQGTPVTLRGGAVGLLVPQDGPLFESHGRSLRRYFDGPPPLFGTDAFRGKDGETIVLSPAALEGRPLVLAGLGLRASITPERLRRAAAAIAKQAAGLKQDRVVLAMPERALLTGLSAPAAEPVLAQAAFALAEGAALSAYAFDRYRTDKQGKPLSSVTILAGSAADAEEARAGLRLAEPIIEGTWLARDLANAPGNEIFPASLAAAARRSGRTHGFRVTVFDERRLARLNMGGLLAVSRGSARPPRFIILEHGRRARGRRTIVLVGKGVTFDSGGISIKPAANMAEMKMDMAGAAAVLGTVQTAARLDLPVHLIGLIPATENLPGGNALKPGDIIRHLNGKTSEIDNTDAEGRLILADALAFASRYRPDLVIDLATLTGAVVVALGHYATGMFGNSPAFMGRLKESGERTYERVWELPLYDEYDKLIKSDVADVKNVGGRWGGAITAAMFLKHFIGEYPWIHLDIAGTAILEEPQDYLPKGGSGVGVRLLIDFLRH